MTEVKSEMTEVDDHDAFTSCRLEENETRDEEIEESLATGPSDTMMTQGFIPSAERYTPTDEQESKFTPVEHPIRQAAGTVQKSAVRPISQYK